MAYRETVRNPELARFKVRLSVPFPSPYGAPMVDVLVLVLVLALTVVDAPSAVLDVSSTLVSIDGLLNVAEALSMLPELVDVS